MPAIERHFFLEVPASLDAFLASKDARTRYKLKRILKHLEHEYPGCVSIKVCTSEQDVDLFLNHAERIAQKSYLRPLNVGFSATPNARKKKIWLAQNGYFRSYLLYLRGNPSAFIDGINYRRSLYTEYIGFDTEYESLSVGTYLLLKAIEDLAQVHCAEIVDYGFGSDSYKERFSSMVHEEIRAKLYVPRLSNLIFMATLVLSTFVTNFMRQALKRTGVYIWVRKTIRRATKNMKHDGT